MDSSCSHCSSSTIALHCKLCSDYQFCSYECADATADEHQEMHIGKTYKGRPVPKRPVVSRTKHREKKAAIRKQGVIRETKLNEHHHAEHEKLKQTHQQEQQDLIAKHERQKVKMQTKHATELKQTKQTERTRLKAKHAQQTMQLQQTHQNQMNSVLARQRNYGQGLFGGGMRYNPPQPPQYYSNPQQGPTSGPVVTNTNTITVVPQPTQPKGSSNSDDDVYSGTSDSEGN